jgi:hypothetical protein
MGELVRLPLITFDDDGYFHPSDGILTVKMLKEILEPLNDEDQIVMGDEGSWYNNVDGVAVPNEETGHSAVTLYPGEPFDTRQI